MFHTYVASVSSECCVGLQWFSSIFQVFFSSVSEACFKCLNGFQADVASAASEYFKSRSGVKLQKI
jgi:hypothetical protein